MSRRVHLSLDIQGGGRGTCQTHTLKTEARAALRALIRAAFAWWLGRVDAGWSWPSEEERDVW